MPREVHPVSSHVRNFDGLFVFLASNAETLRPARDGAETSRTVQLDEIEDDLPAQTDPEDGLLLLEEIPEVTIAVDATKLRHGLSVRVDPGALPACTDPEKSSGNPSNRPRMTVVLDVKSGIL
jgi:hypothetical protein